MINIVQASNEDKRKFDNQRENGQRDRRINNDPLRLIKILFPLDEKSR